MGLLDWAGKGIDWAGKGVSQGLSKVRSGLLDLSSDATEDGNTPSMPPLGDAAAYGPRTLVDRTGTLLANAAVQPGANGPIPMPGGGVYTGAAPALAPAVPQGGPNGPIPMPGGGTYTGVPPAPTDADRWKQRGQQLAAMGNALQQGNPMFKQRAPFWFMRPPGQF